MLSCGSLMFDSSDSEHVEECFALTGTIRHARCVFFLTFCEGMEFNRADNGLALHQRASTKPMQFASPKPRAAQNTGPRIREPFARSRNAHE
jgi:hypothetical protein